MPFSVTTVKTLGTHYVPSQPTPAEKNNFYMLRMPMFLFCKYVNLLRCAMGEMQRF